MEFNVIHKDTTGSTSEDVRELALAGAPEGTVVVARSQKSGHGQWGRVWMSPGGGLYFSLLLRPSLPESEWGMLSPVVAEAVAYVIRRECGVEDEAVWVKAPNDVMCEQGKLCGILLEAKSGFVVVGCGVNVYQPTRPIITDGRNEPAYMRDLGLPSLPSGTYLDDLLAHLLVAIVTAVEEATERDLRGKGM